MDEEHQRGAGTSPTLSIDPFAYHCGRHLLFSWLARRGGGTQHHVQRVTVISIKKARIWHQSYVKVILRNEVISYVLKLLN